MILGPLAEMQFRRGVQASQGDLSIFYTRPIALTLLIVAALVLVGPPLMRAWRTRNA